MVYKVYSVISTSSTPIKSRKVCVCFRVCCEVWLTAYFRSRDVCCLHPCCRHYLEHVNGPIFIQLNVFTKLSNSSLLHTSYAFSHKGHMRFQFYFYYLYLGQYKKLRFGDWKAHILLSAHAWPICYFIYIFESFILTCPWNITSTKFVTFSHYITYYKCICGVVVYM